MISTARLLSRCAMGTWLTFGVVVSLTSDARAQFVNQAIGGVSVDAHGVLREGTAQARHDLVQEMRKLLAAVPGDLGHVSDRRKVSLRGLQQQIRHHLTAGTPLPDEVKYLGGLTRVEYVFVSPENGDIILAGPGEGWIVGDKGFVVGDRTGHPIVLLDDLLVAFRTTKAARQVGITCSIDPTAEGRTRLNKFLTSQRRFGFRPAMMKGVEQALGQQQITLTGVPGESHYARVLVAADYRMKRIAMNLEAAPIDGLPGYLDLVKIRRGALNQMMPRWWLACDYDPIARSDDGLAWQLRGQGVKVMTEDQIIGADGSVTQTGKVNQVAQEWADTMTNQFEELAVADPVFGQLRNLMDLSIVAALIEKEGLLARAGLELPVVLDADSDALLTRWHAPRTVASQSSFIKKGRQFIITASGGVEINSWKVVSQTQPDAKLTETRQQVTDSVPSGWRWN